MHPHRWDPGAQRGHQVPDTDRAQPRTPCPPPPAPLPSKVPGRVRAWGERERRGEKDQGGLCVSVTCPPRGGPSSPESLREKDACASVYKSRGEDADGQPRRITTGRNRFVPSTEDAQSSFQALQKHNRTSTRRHPWSRPHSSQGQQTNSVST